MDKLTQAREALEKTKAGIDASVWHDISGEKMKRVLFAQSAINRINAALAALSDGEAVEPVAWRVAGGKPAWSYYEQYGAAHVHELHSGNVAEPLYSRPASAPDQSDAALRERVAELEGENARLTKERDGWKNVAELERDRAVRAEARATEGGQNDER